MSRMEPKEKSPSEEIRELKKKVQHQTRLLYATIVVVVILGVSGIYIAATTTVELTGTVTISHLCSSCIITSLKLQFLGDRGYSASTNAVGNSTVGFKYQITIANHQTYSIAVTMTISGVGTETFGGGSFSADVILPTIQPITHDIAL